MDTSDAGSSLIQSYMQAAREALQGAQYNLDGGYSSTG